MTFSAMYRTFAEQPHVPAGSPKGGQFAKGGGSGPISTAEFAAWKADFDKKLPADVKAHMGGDSGSHPRMEAMGRLEVNAQMNGIRGPLTNYLERPGSALPETIAGFETAKKSLKVATSPEYAFSLPRDVTVYAGGPAKLRENNGYSYASTDREMAQKYAGKGGVVREVHLKEGTKVALGWTDQKELILAPGAIRRVGNDLVHTG